MITPIRCTRSPRSISMTSLRAAWASSFTLSRTSIAATLTATPTIWVVSNPFTVVANVPYTVTYVVPSSLRVCESAPVTATVTDQWNNPVRDGTVVTFTATIGLIFAENGSTTYITTTVGGRARATLVAGTTSGPAATWEQAGSANSGPRSVSIITPGLPYAVSLTVNPALLEVGGTALLTATVRDCASNPVADGTPVDFTLAPALGTIAPDPAATTGGIATAVFTAGTTVGTAVITATADGRSATATVRLIPGAPYTVALTVHPTTLVADGSSTAALTATVTDRWGNPVANGTPVTFTLAPALGTIAPNPASTTGGIALATFTAGTVTGTATITATADGRSATATITLVPIPTHYVYLPLVMRNHGPNLVVESISWSPTNPAPGETVIVSVTVRNVGSAPAGTFWVDLYLDPSRPPAPGIPWNDVCSEGVAWRVVGLAPGEARVLRSDQGEARYTFWRGYFAATPNPPRKPLPCRPTTRCPPPPRRGPLAVRPPTTTPTDAHDAAAYACLRISSDLLTTSVPMADENCVLDAAGRSSSSKAARMSPFAIAPVERRHRPCELPGPFTQPAPGDGERAVSGRFGASLQQSHGRGHLAAHPFQGRSRTISLPQTLRSFRRDKLPAGRGSKGFAEFRHKQGCLRRR